MMKPLGRRPIWFRSIWLLAGTWLCVSPIEAAASPRKPKLDLNVQQALRRGSGSERVIIRTVSGQRGALAAGLRKRGHKVYGDHPGIDAVSADLPVEAIRQLAGDPAVASISADADISALGGSKKPSTTAGSTTTTSSSMTFTSASALLTTLGLGEFGMGATIGVAVLDSGLQDDGNFTGRIMEFHDFTNSDPAADAVPYDDYGHGSHVAGLLGSSGATSAGKYSGVAQAVRLLPIKVLDKNGKGKTSALIDAIEYVIANRHRLGIHVINLSVGHPIYESASSDPLVQEVESAVRAGLIVVAAAGNFGSNPETGLSGYGGITSPGNAPSAITVGASKTWDTAIRSDDRVASYSSRGPSWYDGFAKPDLVAPGQSLVSDLSAGSTLAVEYPSLIVADNLKSYLKLSGSSMSTGVVSGLVALMLETNRFGAVQRAKEEYGGRYVSSGQWTPPPYPTANAIKAMLQYSATRLRDEYGVEYRLVDAGRGGSQRAGCAVARGTTPTHPGRPALPG